jgi:hypothetical protein
MLPLLPISILALAFKYLPIATRAQAPGSIVQNGLTEVSAMMVSVFVASSAINSLKP